MAVGSAMRINPTMLRALVALEENCSFSLTAEQLCITQSAVSHSIRALEEIAGLPLVIRHNRGVQFTEAGHEAVRHAQNALSALYKLEGLSQGTVQGQVRLATITSASLGLVPAFLDQVKMQYPEIQISVLIGTDQEVAQWVTDGVADMGISFDAGNCEKTELLRTEFCVISSPEIPLPAKGVTVETLSTLPFLMSMAGCAPMIEAVFADAGYRPNVVMRVNDLAALHVLVGAGHGVSMVPKAALAADIGRKTTRHTLEPEAWLSLWLLKARGASCSRAVSVVMKALEVEAGTYPL